jgi:hypothetical protein
MELGNIFTNRDMALGRYGHMETQRSTETGTPQLSRAREPHGELPRRAEMRTEADISSSAARTSKKEAIELGCDDESLNANLVQKAECCHTGVSASKTVAAKWLKHILQAQVNAGGLLRFRLHDTFIARDDE